MKNEQFILACTHFDKGEYFEAHEVWEDLWNESFGARKFFLQGLIQAAVALHHAGNQNWVGCRKLLASAMDYLGKGRMEAKEIDVDQMIEHIVDFEVSLQKHLKGEVVELPYYQLPRKV